MATSHLPRTLEPEVMDSHEEAADYDAMDHSAVNELFVKDLLEAYEECISGLQEGRSTGTIRVLDCGTGTARIAIELVKRCDMMRVVAVDLSGEMLQLANRNVSEAGLEDFISVERGDCKHLPYDEGLFDVVMSNSLVHHLADPAPAICEMVRLVRPRGLLFMRDLLRPTSADRVEELIAEYAGKESDRQKRLFRESLHAALTLEEVRTILSELRTSPNLARQTSDRHWTVAGVVKP